MRNPKAIEIGLVLKEIKVKNRFKKINFKEGIKMAIYLEFEGIEGNVTADGYKDCIELLSLQFGMGRGISIEPGEMDDREISDPVFSDVKITKIVDNSTAALFQEAVTGSAGKKVLVKFVRTGEDKMEQFMDYELKDCLVNSYSIYADSSSDPIENLFLSFSSILINYKDHDVTNK